MEISITLQSAILNTSITSASPTKLPVRETNYLTLCKILVVQVLYTYVTLTLHSGPNNCKGSDTSILAHAQQTEHAHHFGVFLTHKVFYL